MRYDNHNLRATKQPTLQRHHPLPIITPQRTRHSDQPKSRGNEYLIPPTASNPAALYPIQPSLEFSYLGLANGKTPRAIPRVEKQTGTCSLGTWLALPRFEVTAQNGEGRVVKRGGSHPSLVGNKDGADGRAVSQVSAERGRFAARKG